MQRESLHSATARVAVTRRAPNTQNGRRAAGKEQRLERHQKIHNPLEGWLTTAVVKPKHTNCKADSTEEAETMEKNSLEGLVEHCCAQHQHLAIYTRQGLDSLEGLVEHRCGHALALGAEGRLGHHHVAVALPLRRIFGVSIQGCHQAQRAQRSAAQQGGRSQGRMHAAELKLGTCQQAHARPPKPHTCTTLLGHHPPTHPTPPPLPAHPPTPAGRDLPPAPA